MRELKRLEFGELRALVERAIKGGPKLARKVGTYLCRKFSERILAEIGQFYGGMGISAVSKTVQRLQFQRQQDKYLNQQLSRVEKKVKK